MEILGQSGYDNSSEPEMLEFTEHHGIETDMTGMRSWNCWYSDKQYVIWEINYTSSNDPLATLPYYRLNWRSDNSNNGSFEHSQWDLVKDCVDFESAVEAATQHSKTTGESK